MNNSSLFRRVGLLVALASFAAGVVAGPAAAATTKTVKVELIDFEVLPAAKSVKAGKVTFSVLNDAGQNHEFVVIKTNTSASKLKVSGGIASEKGKVGETGTIASDKTKKLTLTLKPGKYVLISNRAGEYEAGMYASFTVTK